MLSSLVLNAAVVLPPGAKIIERAPVASPQRSRELVLWMDKPQYFNPPPEAYGAIDLLYGPRWIGAARLSLIDLLTNRVINTIDLPKGIPIPAAGYHIACKDHPPHGKCVLNVRAPERSNFESSASSRRRGAS